MKKLLLLVLLFPLSLCSNNDEFIAAVQEYNIEKLKLLKMSYKSWDQVSHIKIENIPVLVYAKIKDNALYTFLLNWKSSTSRKNKKQYMNQLKKKDLVSWAKICFYELLKEKSVYEQGDNYKEKLSNFIKEHFYRIDVDYYDITKEWHSIKMVESTVTVNETMHPMAWLNRSIKGKGQPQERIYKQILLKEALAKHGYCPTAIEAEVLDGHEAAQIRELIKTVTENPYRTTSMDELLKNQKERVETDSWEEEEIIGEEIVGDGSVSMTSHSINSILGLEKNSLVNYYPSKPTKKQRLY